MPITFTVIGSAVDVTVIDENLEAWQDIFRSSLQGTDFAGAISRFRIFRYVSGKLVSAHTFANPFRGSDAGHTLGLIDRLDISYRSSIENPGLVANAAAREANGGRNSYAMEMLGRPGPSFYYEWQEQGIDVALVSAAASSSGWPPTNWPYTRYPKDYCFSRWLTPPGGSIKTYVPEPAVARMTGHVKLNAGFWGRISGGGSASATPNYGNWIREHALVRMGLIADTNPSLGTDFPNSNPNILDPVTGDQADYTSWKVVNDQTFVMAQREVVRLTGEVAIQGGSFYNFSTKLREAGHHGWVLVSGSSWEDDVWEWHGTNAGTVTSNRPQTNYASAPASQVTHRALWITLYESASLDVEFLYGRNEAYINDVSDSEFT
jgi:hypothetical protein